MPLIRVGRNDPFSARVHVWGAGVPVGSAAGCGPLPTCYRSHKLLGRSRAQTEGRGKDLERRQFSPVKTEVISSTLVEDIVVCRGKRNVCLYVSVLVCTYHKSVLLFRLLQNLHTHTRLLHIVMIRSLSSTKF